MFMFETLKLLPAKIGPIPGDLLGVVGFGLAAALWTLLPFFDRGGKGRTSRWVAGAGVFALAYIVALTAYGYMVK